ncbi:hypothetical protein LJ707_16480 [Mucilaginibacter sp. UR6-1]|uniref:hypothetical protein n=1 Tax=Mucilaginibacter sp. UR6-1 TaxID=1435643 RepID=UPI001E31A436|nr:hypothetical protein [Mucilaginibacter sp. UR6-1]MCC8410541.1 hypothetical protein [Mucilaginibacter sp. UR6-1]
MKYKGISAPEPSMLAVTRKEAPQVEKFEVIAALLVAYKALAVLSNGKGKKDK